MNISQRIRCVLALSAVAAMLPNPAQAQHHAEHRGGDRWNGDIRHFHEHDFDHWRGGHWYHGNYGGQFGWWWTVDGIYYGYPQPIYPYPDPYVPPVAMVQRPAETPAPVASSQPPGATWYYCANPKGYYPYVKECPRGWEPVAAQPSPAS